MRDATYHLMSVGLHELLATLFLKHGIYTSSVDDPQPSRWISGTYSTLWESAEILCEDDTGRRGNSDKNGLELHFGLVLCECESNE